MRKSTRSLTSTHPPTSGRTLDSSQPVIKVNWINNILYAECQLLAQQNGHVCFTDRAAPVVLGTETNTRHCITFN